MSLIRSIKNIANGAYAPIQKQLKYYYRPKQYVKKWGKNIGRSLYDDFFSFETEGELTKFKLPNYPHDLFLRKGTSDEPTLRQVFMNIRYEMDLPFEPKTILDGGANVGYASVFFADKYPQAQILSIEPDSGNFEMIEKNTSYYENITPVKSAIWGKSTNLKILNPDMEKWAFEVGETTEDDPDSFQAFSISDLIKKQVWENIDILKLDIEGSEASVFAEEYQEWLPKVKLLIIELHEKMKPGCTEIFEKAINQFNFTASISGENLVYLNNDLT